MSNSSATRRALASFTLELGGRVSCAQLTEEDFAAADVGPDETEGIIDQLRMVEGTVVAVLMRYDRPGWVKVSLRSRGLADVGAVAGSLGGGGHPQAAGFEMETDLDTCKQRTLAALATALDAPLPVG